MYFIAKYFIITFKMLSITLSIFLFEKLFFFYSFIWKTI